MVENERGGWGEGIMGEWNKRYKAHEENGIGDRSEV